MGETLQTCHYNSWYDSKQVVDHLSRLLFIGSKCCNARFIDDSNHRGTPAHDAHGVARHVILGPKWSSYMQCSFHAKQWSLNGVAYSAGDFVAQMFPLWGSVSTM